MNAPLHGVFDPSAVIDARVCFEVEGASPVDGWWLEHAEIHERLDAPYVAVLELRTHDRDFDTASVIGRSCVLTVGRRERERRLTGIVLGLEHMEAEEWEPAVRLHVGPALAALAHTQRSRIFHERTLPQILEQVLTESLRPYGRTVELDLRETYPAREMVVQYRESDLDFVHRLCEEAGITYAFDHEGDAEHLYLTDHLGGFPHLGEQGAPIPVMARDPGAGEDAPDAIFRLRREQRLGPTSFPRRGYDWTRPALGIAASASAPGDDQREREVYEHDRGAPRLGYAGDAYAAHGGAASASVAAQAARCRADRCRGASSLADLRPGTIFETVDHPRPELNGRYAVVEVEHVLVGTRHDHGFASYGNAFVCIPGAQRPVPSAITPRPRVVGVHTATVMAPSGAPIHTDVHGRIRVCFPWDREGEDERASCWVRVAQGWAGNGLGLTFVPRAGMEVVVTFEDGDPDRPLVTGCVRNGVNRVKHALPTHATRSVIRTESVGAQGFNELFFEDRGGAEMVSLHAQRDLLERVLHDHVTRIGRDQANLVKRDHREEIGGAQTLHVKKDRTKTVDASETNRIGASRKTSVARTESLFVGAARSEIVTLADSLTVGGLRAEQIGGAHTQLVGGMHGRVILGMQTLRVRGSRTERIGGANQLSVTGDYRLAQGPKGQCFSIAAKGGDGQIAAKQNLRLIAREKSLVLKAGKSSIELRHDGTIVLRGTIIDAEAEKRVVTRTKGAKAKVVLEAEKLSAEAGKVQMKGKSRIALDAPKITHR
ncbi:MAG: type VI secretion system tip protein TssI/VgrG [Sandaracinaceae bacterium]